MGRAGDAQGSDWALVGEFAAEGTMRRYEVELNQGAREREMGRRPPGCGISGTGRLWVGEPPCGGQSVMLAPRPGTGSCMWSFAADRVEFGPNDIFRIELEYWAPEGIRVVFNCNVSPAAGELRGDGWRGYAFMNSFGEKGMTFRMPHADRWTTFRAELSGLNSAGTFYVGVSAESTMSGTIAAVRRVRVFRSTL